MEILVLLLLYYVSQNPDFPERVKPIMEQLKNSQQSLHFLNDLSAFSHLFGGLKNAPPKPDGEKRSTPNERPNEKPNAQPSCENDEKNPRSPTKGIADDFIQQILDGYLKKH